MKPKLPGCKVAEGCPIHRLPGRSDRVKGRTGAGCRFSVSTTLRRAADEYLDAGVAATALLD